MIAQTSAEVWIPLTRRDLRVNQFPRKPPPPYGVVKGKDERKRHNGNNK